MKLSLLGLFLIVTTFALMMGATVLVGELTGYGGDVAAGNVLRTCLIRFPEVVVWLGGIILLFNRREQHPEVTRYALIGFGGIFMVWFVGALINISLVKMFQDQRIARDSYVWIVYIRFFVESALRAACWVLLFMSLLKWRK